MEGYPYPLTVEGHWPSTSSKTPTAKLQIYFQSKKKSQGGDCAVDIDQNTTTVFFKSAQIRDQVLAKGDHSVTIENQVVKLKVFKPGDEEHQKEESSEAAATGSDVASSFPQTGPPVKTTLSVRVENVPPDAVTCDDLLKLYFETWGGPIKNISTYPEEQVAIITFQSPDGAQKILDITNHCICKVPVNVHPHFDLERNQSGLQNEVVSPSDLQQPGAVVVERLTDTLSRDLLTLLVESISGVFEEEFFLEIIRESDVAVVTFYDPSVAEKFLRESQSNKKFQHYGLISRALEKSRCVKVENVPSQTPTDLLQLYFEKWGGTVEKVTMIPEEEAAIITFKKQEDLEKVLGRKHHIARTPVNVYPYHTSLGSALYGKDRPTWTLPKPFKEKIHPAIREFLDKNVLLPSIDNQMSSHFCRVNMDKTEVQLSPLPTLLRQKNITKKVIDKWKENATDAFRQLLSNYAVFEHAVIPSMWSTIEKDIRSVVKDKAFLSMDNGVLTLAGMAPDIRLLKTILEDVLNKASDQVVRDQTSVYESIAMSPAMFSLYLHEGLQSSALTRHPKLEYAYRNDLSQLTLRGLSVEIIDIKNWILERRVSMKEKTLKLDPSLLEFLRSVDCEDMSGDLFTSKGIGAVYRIENGDVKLMGSTDKALTEAEKRLELSLASNTISLEDLGVIEKPEWRSLTDRLCDTYNSTRKKTVVIKPPRDRDRLIVCGFKQPVSEVSRSLEKFINTHSRIEDVIRVQSYAAVRFINEKKSSVWQKFVNSNEVTVQFDPRRPLIRLSGERVHVQPAKDNFQKIVDALHTDKLTLSKAGAKKYFQEQGSFFLIMIKDRKFVVLLEESHMLEEDEDDYERDRVEDVGQVSCGVQMPGGIIITVRKADICQFRVDAVVNAANEDLKHIGGVALALLNAAGPNLQKWSDQYVAANGRVPPGFAITTEAGNLPCKYVVHAVGPRFSDTDRRTAVSRLKQAVRESLNQAVNNKCASIAVPVISSGVFGFPLELCTETIAKELHAYINDQNRQGGPNILTQIHLVDNNASTVNAMAQAVRKEFAAFNPKITFSHQTRSGSRGRGNRGRARGNRGQGYHTQGNCGYGHRGAGQRSHEPPGYKTPEVPDFEKPGMFGGETSYLVPRSRSVEDSEPIATQSTPEGLRIHLKKGNIQDAVSDVIVNTISVDGDLSNGAISKALLQVAGPQLQSEATIHLSSLGSSKLKYGDMLVTNGYNLNCQTVFHTICPYWNGGTSSEDEMLKQIIRDCLKKAEQKQMFSITFPAIGTGNLCFPKDLVSSLLLNVVHDFSAKAHPRHLKEVTVVVHSSDNETVQSFTKTFRGGRPSPVKTGAPGIQQQSPKKSSVAKSLPGLFGVVSTRSLGVHTVQVGHITLEVSSGDITKERSDAIVNSSNATFSLKSGVSKAILDAAGSAVEQECAQAVKASLQQRHMILTSGGQLPCRHIIHVVGQNSPASIKEMVYNVLKLCEAQNFSSVALPALGTGQGGASPSAVADAMIDALIDFVKKKKGTNLQTVKFLIFQTSMVSDFHQSMLKRQQEDLGDTSVMGWIKGTFDSMTSYLLGKSPEPSASEDFEMVGEEFEPAVFQLCAETQQDLNEARDVITSLIVKEQTSCSIRDSAISLFTREDAEMLSNLQRELTVSIRLNKSGSEPVIDVEGLTRDVAKVESTIRDLIRKVEKNENRKQKAFMVGAFVEWQYLNQVNQPVAFDLSTNYDLEEAFQQKLPQVKINISNKEFEVDLIRKIAKRGATFIELKRLDRKDDNSEPLPGHWEDMKGASVKRCKLQPGSQEYNSVETEFTKTGLQNTILSIERVQNSTLWKSYMIHKKDMDKRNKHQNNEKKLFHGTGPENIDKIDHRGFNRSYAGMHGAMYGNGAYFAVDPSYSSRGYSKPDQLGHKRMYLAKVLVGDYTTGKSGLLSPPAKSSSATDLYDSVTDNIQAPTMFVIFHDVQAYPEYLITFQ
ncbi:protein mono-ADP-ribosyltransferase PARP14-like [Hoplias malabaricus]|uniref:protein mono-ADP-ribosyltransferase PARP14-like n=1 Tax=Hoplias malabaricus TaxID=27720 RepID=UPI003461AD17